MTLRTAIAAMALLICAGSASADFTLNYQGVLTDEAGAPLAGPHEVVFTLYDAEAGGAAVWTETHVVEVDEHGAFTVVLGNEANLSETIDAGAAGPFWLELRVDGTTLSPRRKLSGAATACVASDAQRLGGQPAEDYAPAEHFHTDQHYTKEEMSASDGDAPNTGSNQVHWDNLTGVPAGFADGTDDGDSAGGNTLDQAYDQGGAGAGRVITADSGQIRIIDDGGLWVQGKTEIGKLDGLPAKLHLLGNSDRDAFLGLYADSVYGGYIHAFQADSSQYMWLGSTTSGGGGLWFTGGNEYGNITVDLDGNHGSNSAYLWMQGDEATLQINTAYEDDWSVIFPTGSISSTEMFNEPGLSYDFYQGPVSLTSGSSVMEDVITTSITIPEEGYIHVRAVGTVNFNMLNSSSAWVNAQVDDTAGGTSSYAYVRVEVDPLPASADLCYSLIAEDVFFFMEAGTHTYRLEAQASTFASGTITILNPQITATYIPTSYGSVKKSVGRPTPPGHPQLASETVTTVDLRDLEMQALRAKEHAIALELELTKARLREKKNRR